ncbi:hypothetical protein QJS10_CPB13g01250 [Acorus calamus]|uniref:Uncharacterized protein n=1 Tax=Acorus calamus TaxID=4465 RepID=A0AAV9DEN4_ACOCL|nr:hypothetical protein QJS10_CPB13g01250 [Acorus calamus]
MEGESTPSWASSSDECQMSVVHDAICNKIAAAHGNASIRPSNTHWCGCGRLDRECPTKTDQTQDIENTELQRIT